MELVWPGSYCDKAETQPHYMVEFSSIPSMTLFECRHCGKLKLLPNIDTEALALGKMMQDLGEVEGYEKFISGTKYAKSLLKVAKELEDDSEV